MKKAVVFFAVLAAILTAGIIMGEAAYASCNVVTVMYHNVTDNSSRWDDYCIPASSLEEDIKYFTSRGYETLTASELGMDYLDGKKILLLTFDDGYSGWYTDVLPVLEKYNAKATMFVVGSFINKYGYLNEYQIKEMADCGLIEFGSHTDYIHNAQLSTMQSLYNNTYTFWEIVQDVKNSANILKSITGQDVTSMSWPYGYYTDSLDGELKNSGIKITFSTLYGVNRYNGWETAPFNRINREYSTTPESLYERAESKF